MDDTTTSTTQDGAKHGALESTDQVVRSDLVFPKTAQNARPEEVGLRFLLAVVFVIAIKM